MSSLPESLYVFPPAPSDEAGEWIGDPIGRSNVVTRTKSRTTFHDKNIDRTPSLRAHIINAAIARAVANGGRETVYLHDVIIHGVRVRAITNSAHLIEFWRENWYSPEEWQKATGVAGPVEAQVIVYALSPVPGEKEAAYYSREANTVIFFNTSYYGQLKSWVLGAVGRVLAAEYGIHSIHGACVERDGDGILYIAPTGTGKSTSSYGLMNYPRTRFHSDDWVYVRYGRYTRSNQLLVPFVVTPAEGEVVRGYACSPWIASHPDARGTTRCFDLQNREIEAELQEFDRSRPVQAYAYTSEKFFYLRSNLVENFPDTASAMLRAHLENVPLPTSAYLDEQRHTIASLAADIRGSADPVVRASFGEMSDDTLHKLIASLSAFDNARAMLDISAVFPPARVFTNPMEPVRLTTVFLLARDQEDPVVLEALSLDDFMDRLLVGRTPDGKREIAYNAYRAVDDEGEQEAIEGIQNDATSSSTSLYQAFLGAPRVPDSLREEFTLFRELHDATLCYKCNTILQRDPLVHSKKEAVRLTLEVIVAGVKNRSHPFRLTLDDYRSQLGR